MNVDVYNSENISCMLLHFIHTCECMTVSLCDYQRMYRHDIAMYIQLACDMYNTIYTVVCACI